MEPIKKMLVTCDVCGYTIEVEAETEEELEFDISKLNWYIKECFKDEVIYVCPKCVDFGI